MKTKDEHDRGGFLWSFNTEKAARECLALIVAGGNASEKDARIAYEVADKGWELWIRAREGQLSWLRGFACGFARMTAGEGDVSGPDIHRARRAVLEGVSS